jgi:hypothetical protein
MPSFETPFAGADPTDTLLAFLLRLPVRLVEGLRGFMEVMDVTEVVRHRGSSLGYGAAHREVPIGDHSCRGHSDSLLDLCEEGRAVLLGRRQQTAGEKD